MGTGGVLCAAFLATIAPSAPSHWGGARKDESVADNPAPEPPEPVSSAEASVDDFVPLEPDTLNSLATRESAKRFLLIFGGLFLVSFSFNVPIGGPPVDVLPDWLGATIMLLEILALDHLQRDLKRVIQLTRVLLVVSIFNWIHPGYYLPLSDDGYLLAVLLWLAYSVTLALWAVAWGSVAVRWAEGTQQVALRRFAAFVQRAVPVLIGVGVFLSLPVVAEEEAHPVTVVVTTGAWLTALILLHVLTWRLRSLSLFLVRLREDHEREQASASI